MTASPPAPAFDAAELARLHYCFLNARLLRGGSVTATHERMPNTNQTEWRRVGWCATITLSKLRVEAYALAGKSYGAPNLYVRRPVLRIFWKWVDVAGPGPWWDVLREALPLLEAEIARTVVATGAHPKARSGALSLPEDAPADDE